jgi:Ca-activated chloride channel family protein
MLDWNLLPAFITQFHFMRPWWLMILPSTLFAIVYLQSRSKASAQWKDAIAPHLFAAILVPRKFSSMVNPATVALLLLSLCGMVLAGPSWQQRSSPFVQDEAILVVAIDLSYSMDQTDIQPSRLERAKHKVKDLMAKRGGARTGLIVYAGSAHAVIPLTNDPKVVENFLDALVTPMMPRKGKNPEKVLPIAKQMLDDSGLPGTLLLIADAANPNAVASYSEFFTERQDQLLVLGVGTTTQTDELKALPNEAFFPLEVGQLKVLTAAAGGYYQPIRIDQSDIVKLNRRINNHLSNVVDNNRPWLDSGYFLLFPIAFILLLWFRKGWNMHWCLLLVVIGSTAISPTVDADEFHFADLWMTPDQQGYFYFKQGDYETAAKRFDNVAWRGLSYYLDENFLAAVDVWSAIETDAGIFNLANAWAQSENYVYAEQTYAWLLRRNPNFPGAVKNRKFVQDIIDDINRMSESQQAEQGEDTTEFGEDDPLRAEGAERDDMKVSESEQFTAEQLLADEAIQQMWLRQVQRDPSRFLAVKFAMQLQAAEQRGNSEK